MSAPLNLPLARSATDRNSALRTDPQLVSRLLGEANTFAILLNRDLVLAEAETASLKLVPARVLTELGFTNPLAFLGLSTTDEGAVPAGAAILVFDLNEAEAAQLTHETFSGDWLQLRRSGFGLSDRDAGLLTSALALANWHRAHRFCAKCGAASVPSQSGWSRTCVECANEVFPRNDPAIIVVVTDDQDRILLGSQGSWEENRWSILAGFVDAGETLNAAVEREMLEEAGVQVSEIEYLGSQPWPYPFSLMIGFKAKASGKQEIKPDGVEIERLRWFSREELIAESSRLLLPGKSTISRAMIEHWLGQRLLDGLAQQ